MNALLSFLRSHCIECEPASNGRIRAIESFTQRGESFRRIVILPATLRDVRSWLGY